MPKLWQGILAIHDTTVAFRHTNSRLVGVPLYADRALLMPADVVVIRSGDVDDYLEYLREQEIGPRTVITVDDDNLYRGLLAGPAKVSEYARDADGRCHIHWRTEERPVRLLHEFIRRGGKIQVFCITEEAEAFFSQALIERKHVQSAPLESARTMSDKAELRRVAARCNLSHAFFPHVASREPKVIMASVKSFLSKPTLEGGEFVVLKRTNLANGEGFLKIARDLPEADVEALVVEYLRKHHWNDLTLVTHSETGKQPDVERFLVRSEVRDLERTHDAVQRAFAEDADVSHVLLHRANIIGGVSVRVRRGEECKERLKAYLDQYGRNEILVEAGFKIFPYSNQVLVQGWKKYRVLGPTRQIIDEKTGGHLGNMMLREPDPSAFPQHLSGHPNDVLTREHMHQMETFSRKLADEISTSGEGYDDAIGFDHVVRALDGEVFVLECNARLTASTYMFAMSAQLRDRNWGIVMLNALPTSARSFAELRGKLGGKLYVNGSGGLLPFNTRLMTLETPHCGMVAVAPTLKESLSLMEEAKALIA